MKKSMVILFVLGIFLVMIFFGSVNAYQLNLTGDSTNLSHERNFSHISISDPNLVLYMPFDIKENYVDATQDCTSNFYDGILKNGVVWNASGYYGGGYTFDGVDDYIDLGSELHNNLSRSKNWTVSVWFNPRDNTGSNYDYILASSHNSTDTFAIAVGYNNSVRIQVYDGNVSANRFLGAITLGNWYNVIVVWNGTLNAYLNGALLTSKYAPDVPTGTGTTMGMKTNGGGNYNGSVDEFMFFNRTLSSTEIQRIYNSTYSRFYPTGEMLFEGLDLSSQGDTNISFEGCQEYNSSYLQGRINSREWVNFSACSFNDSGFIGDLDNINFTLRFVSNSNNFYSPSIQGRRYNPILYSNISALLAMPLNLTFPPANSSPYYDYNDSYYGAGSNPTGNPIGGFTNYSRIVNSSDATYYVNTKQEFLDALNVILPGEIVYINDSAIFEFSEPIKIYTSNITVASGRGNNYSHGALLKFEEWMKYAETPGVLKDYGSILDVTGDNVRITGLRFSGTEELSNLEVHSAFYYQNRSELNSSSPVEVLGHMKGVKVNSSNFEMDNCEGYGFEFSVVGIYDESDNSHIHHNYFHNNWWIGLGYGVYVAPGGRVLVEANLFNKNRHSVASSYEASSYEARYNINLGERAYYDFDRHGNPGYAGNYTVIHHNSLYQTGIPVMHFIDMGAPPLIVDGGQIYNNWFQINSLASAIIVYYTNKSSAPQNSPGTNVTIFSNLANVSGNPNYFEPVAIANASSYNVSINQAITFDASGSYSNESSIRYIEWNFADNSSLVYGNTSVHSFSEAGRYLIKIVVSDEIGFLNWTYLNITVNPSNASKTYLDFWIYEKSWIDSPEYVVKRARINNEVVWEQNFSDNITRWQHISIDVPSNLTSGGSVNLNLGIEVLEDYTDSLYPAEHEVEFFDVYFDQISVLRCGEDLVGSYEGDFEYANDTLYSDLTDTNWTNKTTYENSMSGTYAFKVSPVWRGNYTSGESYGWTLNDITLNADCTPSVLNNQDVAIDSNSDSSSGTGTFRPSTESLENGWNANFAENSKVEIPVGDSGEKKQIEVKSVSEEKVVVSVNGEDYEIIGDFGTKIDLDSDGYYDVEITNKKVYSNGVANLKFRLIHEEVPSEQEEGQQENIIDKIPEVIKKIDWKVYVLIGIVIVLIFVLVLVGKEKRRRK